MSGKILGINENKSPTQLNDGGNLTNSPKKMANLLTEIFLKKVNNIKEMVQNQEPQIDPIQCLESWLLQRQNPLS